MDQKPLRRTTLFSLAVLFFVFDLLFQFQQGIDNSNWHAISISAGMCLGLLITSRFPLVGTATYLLFCVALAVTHAYVSVSTLGLYVLAIDWIASKRYTIAGFFLIVGVSLSYLSDGFTPASLLGSILGIAGAVAIGLVLRWSQDRVDVSRKEAREKVYRDLAVELHDTVVRDLSRVIVAAELLTREPNSPALVEQIHASAHEALKSTRTMMAGFAKPEEEETFQQVVGKCGQMLATRSIQLNVDIPDDLHGSMSREAYGALILTLKEGAANILKYASAGSEAELLVERQSSEEVLLTLSNDCGEKVASEPLLSGGFGLENLAARLSNQGGKLSYMKVSDRWILVAEIQMGQPTMPTSEFTPRSEISQPGNARSGKNGLKQ